MLSKLVYASGWSINLCKSSLSSIFSIKPVIFRRGSITNSVSYQNLNM